MKSRNIFALFFLSFILIDPIDATGLKVADSSVRASESLGKIKLIHNDKSGFSLYENGKKHSIGRHSLSPELRTITSKNLAAFQRAGYLTVNKQSDGEFAIRSHVRGEAGGPGGATGGFWLGKFLTHGVFQIGIHAATAVVAVVCPPAVPVFYATAQATVAPIAEATSNVVGLATGVVGAVATGPV
jgi:hypothetical protein